MKHIDHETEETKKEIAPNQKLEEEPYKSEYLQEKQSYEPHVSSLLFLKEQVENLKKQKKNLKTNASDLKKEIAELKKSKNISNDEKILSLKEDESKIEKEIVDLEMNLEKLSLSEKAEKEKANTRKLEEKIEKEQNQLLKDQEKLESLKKRERKG